MRIASNRVVQIICASSAAIAFIAGNCSPAVGAPLALVNTPLYLTPPATPNLIMAIDDSGSMDYELTMATNDGAAWWRMSVAQGSCTAATGASFAGCRSDGVSNIASAGTINFNQGGQNGNGAGTGTEPWEKYVSLFPNGCTTGVNDDLRRTCAYNYLALPPIASNAWARDNHFNGAYFDPLLAYAPWVNGGGYTFVNSSPSAARFDPALPSSGALAINLTKDVAAAGSLASPATGASYTDCSGSTPAYSASWGFRLLAGMIMPADTCVRSASGNWTKLGSAYTVPATGGTYPAGTDVNVRYFPATFYLTAAEAATLPSTYGYTGTTLAGSAPNGAPLTGYEIKAANFATPAQYTAAIQNFANWFTYYRKRHLALRAGLGKAFNPVGGLRVAGFRINDNASDVGMLNLDTPTQRDQLFTNIYSTWTGRSGTPNRSAVNNIVRNFKRTNSGAPIQYACQQNFGMLFTDGFSDGLNAGDGFDSVGNVDGSKGAPYADSASNTMADGVMKAYVGPLIPSPTFPAGKVHPPLACSSASPDPRVDCNSNLHMNFFAITLGTKGIAYDPDAPADPFSTTPPTTPSWPTAAITVDRSPLSVDDLWHATLNGRGQLFNANKPTDISNKLSNVLNSIADLAHSSASSAALNSGSITTDTRVYQARFDTRTWEGQLLAYPIGSDGSIGTLLWDAGTKLPAAASRQIVTVDSSGAPVAFAWANLDSTRQSQLDANPVLGQAKLNYIRGDAANEAPAGYAYRKRPTTKLGDIVDSAPLFVGKPPFAYRDSIEAVAYSSFASANSARQGMIYVGANDGMLHAFNATTGIESFAFIPSKVFGNLSQLTGSAYSHRYFVDGTPSMGDVFFGGAWHTMLVGGLNGGGQGIYALEITDPSGFSSAQSTPNSIVKWEFTDQNDTDLGFTFGQPQIVRLHNGKWAAVFGNGYNNTNADGNASSTGKAALYIVDIQDGSLIKKISLTGSSSTTGSATTPNGLSTPAVVDVDSDRIADFVFVGDLLGNLWKFDIRDPLVANWKVAFQDASANPLPLFVAVDNVTPAPNRQPITEKPVVIRGPSGSSMAILFGTGKYLESVDNTSLALQTFYGIYDRNSNPLVDSDRVSGRSGLQQQSITNEITSDFDGSGPMPPVTQRVLTQNGVPATKHGWYLDLVVGSSYQGEKSVANPLVRNGRLVFTTLIPSNDPCSDGGTSWLMAFDALTGAGLQESPFDSNGDGKFTTADFVTLPDGTKVTASGIKSTGGILTTPAVLAASETLHLYDANSGGDVDHKLLDAGPSDNGRQSWRQIR